MQFTQDLENEGSIGAAFSDAMFLSSNQQPKELFLSSDASAVVEHTKRVLVVEDGEVIHLKVKLSNLFEMLNYVTYFFSYRFIEFCFASLEKLIKFTNGLCLGTY